MLKPKAPKIHKPWTDEELTYLRKSVGMIPIKDIAEALGRSTSSVRNKAYKSGFLIGDESLSRKIVHRYDDAIAAINDMSVEDVPLELAVKHAGWLRMKYVDEELSQQDIADIVGCTRKTVDYWMRKYGIERRDNETRYTERYLRKISETGKGRVPFSKGLTKYDHPSIQLISDKVSGERSPHWKGGSYINASGYKMVRDDSHPHRDKDGYVLEHRLVMEFVLGRLLTSEEVVHHRDQNRLNNFTSNLFLFPNNRAHLWFHTYKTHKDPTITEESFMEEVYRAS